MGTNQIWAKVIGIVLLLYAVAGFFLSPGSLYMSYGNHLHDAVHLITALIFLWAGFAANAPTKKVNLWLGVVYILVGVIGFFGVLDTLLGTGMPDHITHVVVGVISAAIGAKAD